MTRLGAALSTAAIFLATAIDSQAADPPLGALVWNDTGDASDTLFGNQVGSAGDVNGDGYADFLVGAQNYDGDLINEGRALCYLGGPNGLAVTAHWIVEGDVDTAEFGYSVATAGDVNGDGFSDVVVGARRMGDGHPGEGFVFVYLGSATGLSPVHSQFFDSNENVAFLGCSVAAAGDVDADGFCDVIAGARLLDLLATDGGAAFLYPGSASGLKPPSWSAGLAQHGALLGYSVCGAGDVDADGFCDVIAGAYEANDGVPSEGRVFAFHGGVNGLSLAPDWIGDLNHPFAHLGFSVRAAGDVNGDGYADAVVGAPDFSASFIRQGAAFLFAGSGDGLGASPAWSVFGPAPESNLGYAVGTAGDVNGDGHADVVVGAPYFDVTLNGDEGRIETFLGSATGLAITPAFTTNGGEIFARLGYHVATAGDVNGDGRSEFAAGAPFSAGGGYDVGAAYVFAGAADDLAPAPANTIAGAHAGEGFAGSLANLSDVDGDGFSDLAVGSSGFDPGAAQNSGRVVVFRGGANGFDATPAWTHVGATAGAREGRVVVGPGDVDGDGHADLLVAGAATNGVGYFRGAPAASGTFSPSADATFVPDASVVELGSRIAAVGDVNGDGFTDFALRARRVIDNGFDVRVYLGGASGPASNPAVVISLPATGGELEIAGGGDFDFDGRDDLLLGDPLGANGFGSASVMRSVNGAGGALELVTVATAQGLASGERFGAAIVLARDLDGDGDSDVAIGAPDAISPALLAGRVDVFLGGGLGPTLAPALSIPGVVATQRFGATLGAAGDVDRDGRCDLLVGSVGATTQGIVDLFLGVANGSSGLASFTVAGGAAGDRLGATLCGGFDANGDGFSDVAFAAPGVDSPAIDSGAFFVHLGGGGSGRPAAARLTRASSPLPIAPHGFTSTANVGFELAAATAFGRGRVRLEWEVAPAGEPFGSSVATKRGLGEVVDSATSATARADSTALPSGRVHHRVRLRHDPSSLPFATHGPWYSVADVSHLESTLRVAPTASLLAVTAPDPLVLTSNSGGDASSVAISLSNLGGEAMSWSVIEVADEPWLDVTPSAGTGLLASSGPIAITVRADPSSLDPGEYSATLRFIDLAKPAAPHDVAVSFAVTAVSFTPGDRIEAALGPLGDHAFGEFEGVVGMKLKLALIEGTSIGSQYRLELLAESGATIASKIVSPTKPKATLSLPDSGRFRLRVERLGGPAAKAAFSTQRGLPAEASSFAKTVKKGASKQKTLSFVALCGTQLDLELAPNAAFVGPLDSKLVAPDDVEYSIADLGAPFGNGGFELSRFPLSESGAHELRLLDFAGPKKEKVKVKVTLSPPAPGTSVVVLKAAVTR